MSVLVNKFEDLVERRKNRKETGAIWTKSGTKGINFHTIKVKLNQEQIENLVNQLQNKEEAILDLVAFPCKGGEVDGRKPTFRVFPDMRD